VAAQSLKNILKNERDRHLVSNSRYLWPGIIFAVFAVAFCLAIIDYKDMITERLKSLSQFIPAFWSMVFTILTFIFRRLLRSVTEKYAQLAARGRKLFDYLFP